MIITIYSNIIKLLRKGCNIARSVSNWKPKALKSVLTKSGKEIIRRVEKDSANKLRRICVLYTLRVSDDVYRNNKHAYFVRRFYRSRRTGNNDCFGSDKSSYWAKNGDKSNKKRMVDRNVSHLYWSSCIM